MERRYKSFQTVHGHCFGGEPEPYRCDSIARQTVTECSGVQYRGCAILLSRRRMAKECAHLRCTFKAEQVL